MSKRARSSPDRPDAADKRPHWSLGANADRSVYLELGAALIGEEALPAPATSVPGLIASLVGSDQAMRSAQVKIEHKHLLLEASVRARQPATAEQRAVLAAFNDNRILSGRQLKRLGLTRIDRDAIQYDVFRRLNQIWVEYFDAVTSRTGNREILQSKLLKADLHGAVVSVLRSRNPSLIGQRGIVYKETQFTFEIVTETNATKVLLKQHSVFGVVHGHHLLLIYGSNFLYRPSQRSAKKYKAHGSSLQL